MNIVQKCLPPYQAYIFSFSVSLHDDNSVLLNEGSQQAVIIVSELDLPPLSVEFAKPSILVNRVPITDEIRLNLIYDTSQASTLFYAGAFLYNNDVVATTKFEFTEFSFRIQNYFNQFGQSNTLLFRISVYNPAFYMPSMTTIKLLINFPPQQC